MGWDLLLVSSSQGPALAMARGVGEIWLNGQIPSCTKMFAALKLPICLRPPEACPLPAEEDRASSQLRACPLRLLHSWCWLRVALS